MRWRENMKTKLLMGIFLVIAFAIAMFPVQALDFNGPHYNMNIIGVSKDKASNIPAWSNENRHAMFVPLDRKINIYMTQGDDFAMVDADGTDGVARFNLAEGYYEVFIRAVGKPNGEVTITPEATYIDSETGLPIDADTDFYLGSITVKHTKKPVWERVTGMFIADVILYNDDGSVLDTYGNTWIFDIPELYEYWWNYDNHGCKNLQVRFYPVDSLPVVVNDN
jgi:hypothetical protein